MTNQEAINKAKQYIVDTNLKEFNRQMFARMQSGNVQNCSGVEINRDSIRIIKTERSDSK